jgi:hypothetical protein
MLLHRLNSDPAHGQAQERKSSDETAEAERAIDRDGKQDDDEAPGLQVSPVSIPPSLFLDNGDGHHAQSGLRSARQLFDALYGIIFEANTQVRSRRRCDAMQRCSTARTARHLLRESCSALRWCALCLLLDETDSALCPPLCPP